MDQSFSSEGGSTRHTIISPVAPWFLPAAWCYNYPSEYIGHKIFQLAFPNGTDPGGVLVIDTCTADTNLMVSRKRSMHARRSDGCMFLCVVGVM